MAAYIITAFNPTTATLKLNRVYQVPANTGLYLVGKGGDYQVPVVESAPAVGVNLLHASSGIDALNPTDGSYTNLIFGGTGANRGFHPLTTAGIIGANKAYLQLPTAQFNSIPSGARLSMVFEDEATGIENVNHNDNVNDNGNFFNLNGQRVTRPTKGLYISNGKKYVIR